MNALDNVFSKLATLNWKLFVVGFIAGFIGVILTHGGLHVPNQLNPFHGESVKAMMIGK